MKKSDMSINGKKVKKFIKISAVLLGITFVGMFGIALKKKKGSAYENAPEEKKTMEGKAGHLGRRRQ